MGCIKHVFSFEYMRKSNFEFLIKRTQHIAGYFVSSLRERENSETEEDELNIKWQQRNRKLTHFNLETHRNAIGKQCRRLIRVSTICK